MKVLIAGGAGYIGSTVASRLEDDGHAVVLLDDLSTGEREFARDRALYVGDIADPALVRRVFAEHPDIDAVLLCAAKISVPESMSAPLAYYRSNLAGVIGFLEAVASSGCRRLIFSSTAAVYGSATAAAREDSPVLPESPYARSKAMVEQVLRDVAGPAGLDVVCLRYFNPLGADPQRRSGPHQVAAPNVLGVLQRAVGAGAPFVLAGDDWPSRDGSAIRDYVHVWDLAAAHVAAAELGGDQPAGAPGTFEVINLGTGRGTTVLELVAAYEAASGRAVAVERGPRRPGDVPGSFAVCEKAAAMLSWTATSSLTQAIHDEISWRSGRSGR